MSQSSNGLSLNDCFVPSLLALYDTLNDDDDEIRDVGAETVSSILKVSLVPLAAQGRFARWLLAAYGHSSMFAWNVIIRVTGSASMNGGGPINRLTPAESQLQASLREDDALFVEEEQNLFIDEVREVGIWIEIFDTLPQDTLESKHGETSPLMSFASWVRSGLEALNQTDKQDGPLGWTSQPGAFACCTRILKCAKSLMAVNDKYYKGKSTLGALSMDWQVEFDRVIQEMSVFNQNSKTTQTHPSLLSISKSQVAHSLKSRTQASPQELLDFALYPKDNSRGSLALAPIEVNKTIL